MLLSIVSQYLYAKQICAPLFALLPCMPQNYLPPTIHFFCIGAQKAGTTTLRDALSLHPDIYVPGKREAHFVDVNEHFERGTKAFFQKHYFDYASQPIIGNINPSLQLERRSIDRILQTFGTECKFIFILRNPVERAYSHYLMSVKRGIEKLSFADALAQEQYRIAHPQSHPGYYTQEPSHFEKNHYGYRLRSTYAGTIQYLFNTVGRNKVLILFFDELITHQNDVLSQVCRFLNVKEIQAWKQNIHSNEAKKPRSVALASWFHHHSSTKSFLKKLLPDAQLRKKIRQFVLSKNLIPIDADEKKINAADYNNYLLSYFLQDINETEQLLGTSLASWKQLR